MVIIARREDVLEQAKRNIEQRFPMTKVSIYSASMTDYSSIAEIVDELGTIDILVLNAAVAHSLGPTLSIEPDEFANILTTNVVGPYNLAKAFLKLQPRSSDMERTIIYTSTAASHLRIPGTVPYTATKAAGNYLFSAVAQEKEIRAFTFHPAIGFTPMAQSMGFPADAQYDERTSTILPYRLFHAR